MSNNIVESDGRFTFGRGKLERNEDLNEREVRTLVKYRAQLRTYLIKGSNVKAQMIALIPPMTSSAEGAGPVAGHKPFTVYSGDVPMSEYIIPLDGVRKRRHQDQRRTHPAFGRKASGACTSLSATASCQPLQKNESSW